MREPALAIGLVQTDAGAAPRLGLRFVAPQCALCFAAKALDECAELGSQCRVPMFLGDYRESLNDVGIRAVLLEVLEGEVDSVGRTVDGGGSDFSLLSLPTCCHALSVRVVPDKRLISC